MRADEMLPVLIVGCGDIGERVARLHLARGDRVTGVVRSRQSAERLRTTGMESLQADLDDRDSLSRLPTAGRRVYYFAPPPETGSADPRLRRFLRAMADMPVKLVYISTSGVYGDCRGAWVDETTAPNPQTDRAKRRYDAETALREWSERTAVPIITLRVGGIYGPERLPVDRIRAGRPMLREEEAGYTNRIHADDLAEVCMAAMDRAPPGSIYNVSDGRPGTMTQYFNAVADAYGLPRPPVITRTQAEQQLSAALLSFLDESRRMNNSKMLRELDVRLRYPDLESGLRASRGQGAG